MTTYRRILSLLFIVGLAMAVGGCWIATPAKQTAITGPYHSSVISVTRDIDVVNMFGSNIAYPHPAKGFGRNQRVLATIPADTKLQAKGTTFRRMQTSVTSLNCYSAAQDISFQISEKQLKEWKPTIHDE